MLVIVSPDFALTNLLSMNNPVFKVIFLPLGAVRWTVDILRKDGKTVEGLMIRVCRVDEEIVLSKNIYISTLQQCK